jgi:Phage integrase, N-terminal SAM-like domain
MAEAEISQFLSGLATEGRVSASTQNQALNALLFLYHEVLNKKIGLVEGVVRAKATSTAAGRADEKRSQNCDRSHGRRATFDGNLSLWWWFAINGVLSAARQRCGLFSQRDRDSSRQR